MAKKRYKQDERPKYEVLDFFSIDESEIQELFLEEFAMDDIDIDNIWAFLNSGLVDVNEKNADGWTILHFAVMNDFPDIVKSLLYEFKMDVDLEDDFEMTPLYYAIDSQNSHMATILIDAGANLQSVFECYEIVKEEDKSPYEKIDKIQCPYCSSSDISLYQTESDWEGDTAMGYDVYECNKCDEMLKVDWTEETIKKEYSVEKFNLDEYGY